MTDNTGRYVVAGHEHILCPVSAAIPHRVDFYVEHDGEISLIHTRHIHNQQEARDLALTMLLNAYLLVGEPLRLRRLYWCELTPVRRENGRWTPDPAAADYVDAAYLNSETGQINFELDASMCRRRQVQAAVDNHTGTGSRNANAYRHGFSMSSRPWRPDPPALPKGMTEWDADTVVSGEPLGPGAPRGGDGADAGG